MIDRFLEYAASLDYRQRHDLLRRISSFWTVQDNRAWNLLKALIDEVLSEPLGRFEIAALFPVRDANALSSDIFLGSAWNISSAKGSPTQIVSIELAGPCPIAMTRRGSGLSPSFCRSIKTGYRSTIWISVDLQ